MIDTMHATNKLVRQFTESSETLDHLTVELGSRENAIAGITEVVATTFLPPEERTSMGGDAMQLSAWHRELKADCSARFRELTEGADGQQPLSREEANQDEMLVTLNGVRRGVRSAMRQSYKMTKGHREKEFRKTYGIDEVQPYERQTELSDNAKESLEEAKTKRMTQRPRDILTSVGGAAVAVAGEAAFSGDARVWTYALGGGLVLYSGVRRLFAKFDVEDREKAVDKAERIEEVATILPKVKPPHGMRYAIQALSLRMDELELKTQVKDKSTLFDHDAMYAARDIATDLTLWGGEEGLSRVVRDLLWDYEYSSQSPKSTYFGKRFQLKTDLLDEFVPIDQDDDALTPTIDGKKRWADYIRVLAHPDSRLDPKKIKLLTGSFEDMLSEDLRKVL